MKNMKKNVNNVNNYLLNQMHIMMVNNLNRFIMILKNYIKMIKM